MLEVNEASGLLKHIYVVDESMIKINGKVYEKYRDTREQIEENGAEDCTSFKNEDEHQCVHINHRGGEIIRVETESYILRKVQVKSCAYDTWWYTHLVGQIIEIRDKELKDDYIALGKHRAPGQAPNGEYLWKSDCELLPFGL